VRRRLLGTRSRCVVADQRLPRDGGVTIGARGGRRTRMKRTSRKNAGALPDQESWLPYRLRELNRSNRARDH
jgi:hypothetical protein